MWRHGSYTHLVITETEFVYFAVRFKILNVTQINWDSEVLNSLSDIHKQIIFNNHAAV